MKWYIREKQSDYRKYVHPKWKFWVTYLASLLGFTIFMLLVTFSEMGVYKEPSWVINIFTIFMFITGCLVLTDGCLDVAIKKGREIEEEYREDFVLIMYERYKQSGEEESKDND